MIKLPSDRPILVPNYGSTSQSRASLQVRLQRRTLFDLSPLTHCSVIGTCLNTVELRKIIKKLLGESIQSASDHDIHMHGVRFASVDGLPSKLLNKALDSKHEVTIRRFNKAKVESEVKDLWDEAKKLGQIEGAYWAVITHPATSETYFNSVFGDVHMLSHLVGSANRADIRRLAEADVEITKLRQSLECTQLAMRSGFSRRDQELQRLRTKLAEGISKPEAIIPTNDEPHILSDLVSDLRQQLATQKVRTSGSAQRMANTEWSSKKSVQILRAWNKSISNLRLIYLLLKRVCSYQRIMKST